MSKIVCIHYRFVLIPTNQGINLNFCIESDLFEPEKISLVTISGAALNDVVIEPNGLQILLTESDIVINIASKGVSYSNFKNQSTFNLDAISRTIKFSKKTSLQLKHILSCGPNVQVLNVSNIKFKHQILNANGSSNKGQDGLIYSPNVIPSAFSYDLI
jgi:hypothetical protein